MKTRSPVKILTYVSNAVTERAQRKYYRRSGYGGSIIPVYIYSTVTSSYLLLPMPIFSAYSIWMRQSVVG